MIVGGSCVIFERGLISKDELDELGVFFKKENWSNVILEFVIVKYGIWNVYFYWCLCRVLGYLNTRLEIGEFLRLIVRCGLLL